MLVKLKSEQELTSEYGPNWRNEYPFRAWYHHDRSQCVLGKLGQVCDLTISQSEQNVYFYLKNDLGCFLVIDALIAAQDAPICLSSSVSPVSKTGNDDDNLVLSSRSKLV